MDAAYDVALVHMMTPVDFQPNIIPICLPINNDDLVGRIGSATGKFLLEPTISRNLSFSQKCVFHHINKK